jgi:TetR/AcrR family transcriptional repressor of nem operon
MGRTKEFDEEAVLQKAMELFWKQGYEKTSMSDLVEHMGIHRKSLYDTYGDKHSLYIKAIDYYRETTSERLNCVLLHAKTASEAVKAIFEIMIHGNKQCPWGCFIVNAATELALRDQEVKEKTEAVFTQTERLILELVQKGQESGEFSRALSADSLAEILHCTLLGVRVYTRTSVNKEKLNHLADNFIQLLKCKD